MGDRTGYDRLDIVCDNCHLDESQHNFAGGSMVFIDGHYICNGYSQKKLLTKEEVNEKVVQNDEGHANINK